MNDHPLPWAVIQPETDQHVYIVDAEDNQVVRMAAGQAGTARHIAECVNACAAIKTAITEAEAVQAVTIPAFLRKGSFTESEGGEA